LNKINIIEEKALKAKDRKALPDSVFGLPEDRKYPMPDEEHVRKAIQFFGYCPKNKKKELAKNINKMAKKYKMKLNINKNSPFYKYADKEIINESFDPLENYYISPDEFKTIKESDFGLKNERSFPLANKMQILYAIQNFDLCPSDKKGELARNINIKLIENSLTINIDKSHPFHKYTAFKVVSDDGFKVLSENSTIGDTFINDYKDFKTDTRSFLYKNNEHIIEIEGRINGYFIGEWNEFKQFETFVSRLINEYKNKEELKTIDIISIINCFADNRYVRFDEYKRFIKGEQGIDYFVWLQIKLAKDIKQFLKYKIYEEQYIHDDLILIKKIITVNNYKIIKRYIQELIHFIDISRFSKVNEENKHSLNDILEFIDNIEFNNNVNITKLGINEYPVPETEDFLNKKKELSTRQLYELMIKSNIIIDDIKDELDEKPEETITEESLNKITEGIELTPEGDVRITINPKKSFMDEYAENHKLLVSNFKNGNYEGMKLNLAYLFTLINFIEREYIYNKNKKVKPNKLKDAEKARMFAINDFKRYLAELQKQQPDFDFTSYYKNSNLDKIIIDIKADTIVGIKKLFQKILTT